MLPRAQQDHADLGLVNDDATEDLRPKKNAPAGAPTPAGGDQNHPSRKNKELYPVTIQPTTNTAPSPRSVPEAALRLDAAVNLVDLARNDVNRVLQALATDAGLFLCVDLVTAVGHLKQASTLLDRSADQIEAREVQR